MNPPAPPADAHEALAAQGVDGPRRER